MVLTETLINGISLMAIATVASLIGVWFLIRYVREKKKLLPFVSILGFCWVAQFLGPLVTFWSLVFTGSNIDPLLYFQLSYFITPISIINSVWLGFSIFNPKRRNLATYIFIGTAVLYYVVFFMMPTANFVVGTGEMLDISLKSLIQLLCFIYILAAIFLLGGGFLMLRKKVTVSSERARALYMGIAYILFGMAAIIDTLDLGITILIVGRIGMAIYLMFVYLGFSSKAPAKDAAPPAASA